MIEGARLQGTLRGACPARAHQAESPLLAPGLVCMTNSILQSNIRAKRGRRLPLESWALSLELE